MPKLKKPSLKITMLLPLPGSHPIGGFKIVYEYANYLVSRGHDVTIFHPAIYLIDRPLTSLSWRERVKTVLQYLRIKLKGDFKPTTWFKLNRKVKLRWVWSLAQSHIPDADVLIATAWETTEWAATYAPRKGRRFYLIQHLETWSGAEERVLRTWKLPLEKVVISTWLERIAREMGEPSYLIHNGLDFERFRLLKPQDGRDPNQVLMLYHSLEWKGSADGLAAFELAQREEPGLKLTLFGLPARPADLPASIMYHENPAQELLCRLFNQASIFLAPSWAEGFGLPAAEALQCGAALVSTDIEGSSSFAIDGETALLSPIKDPPALAANLLRLYRDQELRLELAQNGHALIQDFTWEAAGGALEALLLR